MKKLLGIVLVFISYIGYSQNNVEARDPIYQTDFSMDLIGNHSSIGISKYKSPTIKDSRIIFNTEIASCDKSNGIELVLSTGETLYFENARIACVPMENGNFHLYGSLLLTIELYHKLSQIEILDFKLGTTKVPVVFKEKGENLKVLFKFSEGNY